MRIEARLTEAAEIRFGSGVKDILKAKEYLLCCETEAVGTEARYRDGTAVSV